MTGRRRYSLSLLGRVVAWDASESTAPFLPSLIHTWLTLSADSLAYVEMRLLMTLLLWHFNFELDPRSKEWSRQEVYLLWQKPPLYVKVSQR